MQLKVISICACLFFISCIQLQAQYQIKTGSESATFAKDSVILIVDDHRGKIDWQVSQDSIHWELIVSPSDTLRIRIDSNAVYRAQFSEGTCEPVSRIQYR